MTPTHKKRDYPAECVQWTGANTAAILALLNADGTVATRLRDLDAIIVRFPVPLPDRKSIDTLLRGWWVVTQMNGVVKCYSDEQFKIKYEVLV